MTLPFVICSYVFHLLWPIGLSVTYQTAFVSKVTSPAFLIPTGLIAVGLFALIFYRKKICREVWLGLLLIFVPLLPVLNLGQVSREEYLVFDHYLYLSVAGLTYLITLAFLRLGAIESKTSAGQSMRLNRPAIASAGVVVLLVAMTVVAALENRPWADSYLLWSNVARVRPNYWAGPYNAGLALLDAKRLDEAQLMLERAAALNSNESNVLAALGRSYDLQGQTASAVASFKRALEIDPEMFQSYNDLGAVYFRNKDYKLAEMNFGAALRLRPDTPVLRFNLGLCYAREERYNDAIRELERVIQMMPRDAYALYELGLAYEKLGRMEEARRVMEKGRGLANSEELANKIAESLNRCRGSVTP
jgi:tetratricopeptide (TPR) repeat protein